MHLAILPHTAEFVAILLDRLTVATSFAIVQKASEDCAVFFSLSDQAFQSSLLLDSSEVAPSFVL